MSKKTFLIFGKQYKCKKLPKTKPFNKEELLKALDGIEPFKNYEDD